MISAEIRNDVVAQSGDCAIVLHADFDRADLCAAMNRGLHIFTARLDPLHRFAKLDRNPTEQSLFRINIQLRSEAAADFRRDDSQLVFGDADHQSELGSQQMRNLRRRPNGKFFFAGKVASQYSAGLHRDWRETLMNHLLRNDLVGGFHRRIDIAFARCEFVSDVVAEAFVNNGATVRSRFNVDHGRQFFVINRN